MDTKDAKYDFVGVFHQGIAIVVKDSMYGAILQGGYEIIDPSYEYISPFKDGYAYAIKNGNFFVLNLSGNMCVKDGTDYIEIPRKYQQARDFKDGLCCVCHDEKWGAIDKNGHEVIPTQYDYLSDFTKGVAIYRILSKDYHENKYLFGFLHKNGSVFPAVYDSIWVNDITGYIHTGYRERPIVDDERRIYNHPKRLDCNGRLVAKNGLKYIILNGKYDYVEDFSNGVSLVCKDGLWGSIDIHEHLVVPIKYTFLYPFETNVTIGGVEDKYKKELKADFIQIDGKVIGSVEHICKIAPIDGDVSIFCVNKWSTKKYGIINKSGTVLLEAEYDIVRKERTGLYRIEADSKFGLFDIAKGLIIPCKFDAISIKDNMFVVQINKLGSFNLNFSGKCLVLNDKECVELPDYCFVGRDFVNGYAPVVIGEKWGIIDANYDIVLEALYDNILLLCDDVFRVSQKKSGDLKHGIYIIGKGEILSAKYDKVEILTSSLFIFGEKDKVDKKTEKYGVIDKNGKIILPQYYYDIKIKDNYFMIKEYSSRLGTTSNKNLLADFQGKIIVKSQYTFVNVLNKDWAITNNNSLLGFVNLHTMKELVPSFDEIEEYEDGMLLARKEDLIFYLNNEAKKVVKKAGNWEVIPDDIYWVGEFHDGIAKVLIDKDAPEDVFIDESNNLVLLNGQQHVTLSSHTTYAYPFDNKTNCAVVKYGNMTGLINRNGDVICITQYSEIKRFSDSLTTFLCKSKDGKFGILRLKEGMNGVDEIVECKYSNISYLEDDDKYKNISRKETCVSCGFFLLEDEERNGVANNDGKMIIPCMYSNVLLYERNWLKIYKENPYDIYTDFVGLTDMFGNLITPPKYRSIQHLGSTFFSVCDFNKWGIMKADGQLLTPLIYDKIGNFDGFCISVYYKDHQGYINTEGLLTVKDENGNYLPINTAVDFVCDFDGSKAKAYYKGFQGFVDIKGEIIIKKLVYYYDNFLDEGEYRPVYLTLPNQYDWAFDFVGQYAIVIIRDKYGVINRAFESIVPPIYDKIEIVENNNYYSFLCNINEKKYLADEKGSVLCEYSSFLSKETKSLKEIEGVSTCSIQEAGLSVEVVPNEYQYGLDCWEHGTPIKGLSIVKAKDNTAENLYGCINEFGDLLLTIKYSDISFSNGFILAKEKTDEADYYRAYDTQGKLLFSSTNESFHVICRNVYFKNNYIGDGRYKLIFVNDQGVKVVEGESTIESCEITGNLIKVCLKRYYNGDVYGLVSKQGEVIIPFEYKSISNCVDGCFAACEHIRSKDSKVFDEFGNIIFSTPNQVYGIICRNVYVSSRLLLFVKPDEIIEICTRYDISIDECEINDNIIKVCTNSYRDDDEGDIKYYGVFTKLGKTLLPIEYRAIGDFIDGHAIVKNSKYFGVINSNYQFIIPCVYDKIDFEKRTGLFQTRINVKMRYSRLYSKNGKNPFNSKDSEWNDIVMFRTKDGRNIVYLDEKNLLFDSKYMHIGKFVDDVAIVIIVKEKRLYYGMINMIGEVVLPFIYSYIGIMDNGMYKCKLKGKVGIVDKNGNYIVPNSYLAIGEYKNGLSLVITSVDGTYTKDGLREYGYMDFDGKIVLSACSYISKQADGLSVFCKYGKWGFYEIEQHTMTIVNDVSFLGLLHNDLAKVNFGGTFIYNYNKVIGGKWGFVNRNGDVVINPDYDYVFDYSEGIAAVKKGNKYGFIDIAGTFIVPCEYDKVEAHFKNGEGELVKGDKIYVFDRTGNVVLNRKKEKEYYDYDDYGDNMPRIFDNPYYNDNLDMDQQSIEFWNSL